MLVSSLSGGTLRSRYLEIQSVPGSSAGSAPEVGILMSIELDVWLSGNSFCFTSFLV